MTVQKGARECAVRNAPSSSDNYTNKRKTLLFSRVSGGGKKEFELIRTVRSGECFFKVETQFVSAVYNVKYLKMDCLVYGYIQHLLAYNMQIE